MNKTAENIFGRRLCQARQMKGMTMEELGAGIIPAVSRQAINKYEKGQTMPDSRMLLAFGNALGVKPDYFFRPFTVEVDRVKFRKGAKLSERRAAAIRERVREMLERYLEAEQLCCMQTSFSVRPRNISSIDDVGRCADEVRATLRLGTDGISSVIEVLEDNGIKVIEVPEDKAFDGLSGYACDNIPIIVVNGNLGPEHKRFALLHELGHLVMEFDRKFTSGEVEDMCNIFASELLLPSSVLVSTLGHRRHDISLAELMDIRQRYGISVDSIMAALRRLDVISGRRYDGYLRKKKSFPDFKAIIERPMAISETSGRFARMVYRALADGVISFSKAATLLNLPVESVKRQLQFV